MIVIITCTKANKQWTGNNIAVACSTDQLKLQCMCELISVGSHSIINRLLLLKCTSYIFFLKREFIQALCIVELFIIKSLTKYLKCLDDFSSLTQNLRYIYLFIFVSCLIITEHLKSKGNLMCVT